MSATVLSLVDRLPAERPVHRDQTVYAAAHTFLMVQLAIDLHAPAGSELIDQLVHTHDRRRRLELADMIGRTAP